MSLEVDAIYKGILEQVMLLEKTKKELSKQILIHKNSPKRLDLIYRFLSCDLNKHELFEQAAVIAINNNETGVLDHLKRLYEPFGNGSVIEKIRREIRYTRRFMEVTKRAKKDRNYITFTERRMVQEIHKYVLAQCRAYSQVQY